MAETYEKYFDSNYLLPYYFNPVTEQSVWEMPTGPHVTIIDKSEQT
jgi:hypothetical protein